MNYDDPFDSLREATNRLVQQMFPSDEEYQRKMQDDRHRQLACYLRGMRFFVKEDYDGAIREFEEAKRYTYMNAGSETYDKLIDEAKEKLAAIEEEREAEKLGITTGELRERKRKADEEERRQKAEQFNRDGISAYDNGDYNEAVKAFQEAVWLTPTDEYRERLANAKEKAAKEAEAAKKAEAAKEAKAIFGPIIKGAAIGAAILGIPGGIAGGSSGFRVGAIGGAIIGGIVSSIVHNVRGY